MAQHRFESGQNRYLLRMAGPEELDRATRWTQADPDHAGRVAPAFWIEQSPSAESWLLEDREGPIFFFKAVRPWGQPIIEIHVQFAPLPEAVDALVAASVRGHHRGRIARALIDGTRWLEGTLQGISELRFESEKPALIHFCQRHLGFKRDNAGRLFKTLKACTVQGG